MRMSWKLGRVAGIDLFFHPSALLIFFLTAQARPTALESVAFAVMVLTSVVLHELGHALMARRYGIGTEDITLYLFGGVARLQRMPRSAGPEILVALAGPAVNLALVAALTPLIALARSTGLPTEFLRSALAMNLVLALFNLLPIFPMDGGRVLRALLSGWKGRVRATELAAGVGQTVALVGGLVFLALGVWQLVVLALFVYVVAGLERAQVVAEDRERHGFQEVPVAPLGFRWTNRGDGVWRLVPVGRGAGLGSGPNMELIPIVELGVAEARAILAGHFGQADLPRSKPSRTKIGAATSCSAGSRRSPKPTWPRTA